MPRPSIAVLYVGGSIGMIRNQKTGRIEPIESIAEIHRFLPEIQREAALKFFPIANLGSSEVTPDHWVTIATTIAKNYDAFDGFVVIHGTNTMSYTAGGRGFNSPQLAANLPTDTPSACCGAVHHKEIIAGLVGGETS